jgi:hypothetical protein
MNLLEYWAHILLDDYCLSFPTATPPYMWAFNRIGYVDMRSKPTRNGNWLSSGRIMTGHEILHDSSMRDASIFMVNGCLLSNPYTPHHLLAVRDYLFHIFAAIFV